MATFHSTMNYLFNGFYFTRQVSTVFGFILIFMILSMAYTVFINIEHQRSMTIVVSFVLVMAIIFMALLKSSNYTTMSPFMKSFELAAAYFFILILYKNDNMTHTVFKTAMGLLMVVEVAASFVGNLGNAGKTSKVYADTIIGRYEIAEDYIHSIEKDAKISVFIDGENVTTPVTNMLSGVDYVITNVRASHINDGLELLGTYNKIDIYKNNYVVKNGFYVNDNILDLVYDNEEIFSSTNYLANNTLGGEDLYEIITGELDVLRAYSVQINSIQHVTNQYQISFAPDKSGNLYSTINGGITYVGDAVKDEPSYYIYYVLSKPLLHHETNAQFALFDNTAYEKLYQGIKKAELVSESSTNKKISFESDKNGYALLPVPSENWSSEDLIRYYTIGDTEYALVKVNTGLNEYTLEKQSSLYLYILMMLICLAICVILSRALQLQSYEKVSDSVVVGRISKFSFNNRVYLTTFTILSTIFLIYLFIRSTAPFGTGFFPSHDGIAQTFPLNYGYYQQLFSGDFSIVDYSTGLVQTVIGKPFLLLRPLYYLVGILPLSSMPFVFTMISYVLFILPAWSIIIYLTHRPNNKNMDKTDLRLIPFALSYSLSAYMISFMSHHTIVTVAFLFPLLMLSLEQLIYKKRSVLYVILLTYIMMNDFYTAFITCEFIFLYFFCQHFDSFKDMIVRGLRVAFYSIISAGMSAIFLIHAYLTTVQNSPYQAQDSSVPSFSFTSDFLNIFNYAKIAPRAVIIEKDFSAVNMYCGLLMILLIPLYIQCKRINLSERIREVALLVLLFVSFGNPFLNYVMHGLHIQTMVPNRFALYYIFLLITMIYSFVISSSEIEYEKKNTIATYVWAAVLGALFMISSKKLLSFSTMISLVFIVIYMILITLYVVKKSSFIKRIIALTLIAELLITAFNYTKYSIYSSHINRELDSYDAATTISERNHLDSDHNRTEYLSSYKNSSMILNTESISFFNSNINQENLDMIGFMGADVPAITNNIGYELSNPLSDIFLNVRYHMINQYFKVNETYSYMKEIDYINNISLYENPYNVGFGFLIRNDSQLLEINDHTISGDYSYDSYIEFQNDIARGLTGQNLYEYIDFSTNPDEIANDPRASFVMSDYSNYEYDNPNSTVTVCIGIGSELKGDFYLSFGAFSYLANKTSDEQDIIYLEYTGDQYDHYAGNNFYLVNLNVDTLSKIHDVLSESVLYDIHDSNNSIFGKINAASDGLVYISLPYKDAFKVTVDGKEVETTSLFSGIGIPVTAGEHEICITYEITGLGAGIAISLATLLGFIALSVIQFIIRKRKVDEPEPEDTEEAIE